MDDKRTDEQMDDNGGREGNRDGEINEQMDGWMTKGGISG